MIREIIIDSDVRLTTVCEPVTAFDGELCQLVDDLFATMYAKDGLGLAAPQIGVLKQVFVMDVRDGKKPHNPIAFVNPAVLRSGGESVDDEGCLSMPGLHLSISRSTHLLHCSQTLHGDSYKASLSGLEARVFQHELDHTQGILFTARASVEELDRAVRETVIAGKK